MPFKRGFEMKFSLECSLQLSKPLPVELKPFVEKANGELFRKGVPMGKEGARITSFSSKDSRILLSIEGTTYLRPHAALLRFRNYIAEELGKKHKVGIKGVSLDSYVISGIELEKAPLKEVTMPFAKRVWFEGRKANIELAQDIPPDFMEKGGIDRMVSLVQEKVADQHYAGKAEFREELFTSAKKKIAYKNDPAADLEKLGWIRRTAGKGQWVLGREVASLINVFKDILVEQVYEPLGYKEMYFPKFEQWSVPAKSGHAKSVYPDAYFVMVPEKSSPEFWEPVKDYFKLTGDVDTKAIMERVVPAGILSYAQCPPFWAYLEDRTIDPASLPLKVFDWSGPTFRNEAGGTQGLARLEEFHRVETLWVGTEEQVIETRKQLVEKLKGVFDKALDLEFSAVRVTPWWMAHEGHAAEGTKGEISTIDFEAWLPYRGLREKSEWLEIQNVSVNGDKYPKAFRVRAAKGELWSGCGGGSFERWLAAFLGQKGVDPKDWPADIRERFREKAKGITELKFL